MPKSIIIADDHPFTAEGMEALIRTMSDLAVVGIAKNGIEAISLIKRHTPDLALLDLSMPGANGLEVFTEAKLWSPETRFAIITGISAASLFERLYDAGIDGLFVKNSPPDSIRKGLVQILDGERVISKEAMAAIKVAQKNEQLSKREIDVLKALAKGQNSKEIGEVLGVSSKTVDNHRTNLLRKMNVNSTASLLVKALREGLIPY